MPGKETRCGELMHWSVRLISEESHPTSTLRNWVMVRDNRGPSWIPEENLWDHYIESMLGDAEDGLKRRPEFPKLEEDAMCSEEEELFKLWKRSSPQSGEPGDATQDMYSSEPSAILRVDTADIRHPKRPFADDRKNSLMMEMDSSIARRRHQQRDTAAGTT